MAHIILLIRRRNVVFSVDSRSGATWQIEKRGRYEAAGGDNRRWWRVVVGGKSETIGYEWYARKFARSFKLD
jgi:hypothetical protein